MRNFILIMALVLFGCYGFSQPLQTDKVPAKIKQSLNTKFPQTIDIPVSWSMDKGNYKASMTIMDAPAFMVIDTLGRTVRIERRINETYLPKKSTAYLKKLDPNYQVVSAMRITDSKGKETFRVVAKISSDFDFDTDGSLTGSK